MVRVGRLLIAVVVTYVLLATPWYLPRDPEPLVAYLPLWGVIVLAVVLTLGYLMYFVAGIIERVVRSEQVSMGA